MVKGTRPLVSVIMPVYNARKYVEQAIESVLNQSYENIELILIDDGATDGSGEVCDRFAQADARVMVLHQRNGGICNARNHGLQVAKGKYIAFCDHDDEMLPGCIERAVRTAENSCTSLVKFTYHSELYDEERRLSGGSQVLPNGQRTIRELVEEYPLFNATIRVIWNGLYLAKDISQNGIIFDENVKLGMEDYLFNLEFIRNIDAVTFLSKAGYEHYYRSNQSTYAKYSREKLEDKMRTAIVEKEFLQAQRDINPLCWVRHQAQYLNMYLATLLHADSDLTFHEKCTKLKEANSPERIGLNCSKLYCFRYLFEKPKQAITVVLFNMGLYEVLILIYSLYHRIRIGGGSQLERKQGHPDFKIEPLAA